ncbi:MAG: hypothetical protein DMF59_01875 [Acidobacteria bacterium]|nr:MAG: hypothetical protein DMF59_01875 [Acidobacteriota bacterium]
MHDRSSPKSPIRFVCSLLAIVLFASGAQAACTTFCMSAGGRFVFGANYDWDTGVGMLMVNKRLVSKESLTLRPTRWTSRFASITLNQYGREFPTGGMNEAGLVVALMALADTQYPAVDSRPSVGILEWIQYQLDLSADIDEVLQRAAQIRIAGQMGLHYLVSDRTGRAVTFEYLGGTIVAHHDGTLPFAVLTNDTYDRSIAYLRTITGFGGTRPVPTGIGSLERLAQAASMIRQTDPSANAVERAFTILDAVHQPYYTKWSVVYDPNAMTVYFRTDRNPNVRSLSFGSFDGACAFPVKTLDINGDGSGDMAAFVDDYSSEANTALVYAAYAQTPMLRDATDDDKHETAMHPEGDVCVQVPRGRAVRR